ncbi:MAG: hypothetical protein Fur006_16320 [Coleofasciculaceae cyanobacterium]
MTPNQILFVVGTGNASHNMGGVESNPMRKGGRKRRPYPYGKLARYAAPAYASRYMVHSS